MIEKANLEIFAETLLDLAKSGAAVIIISQDLDEIFEICDKIAVIADGNLSTLGDIASVSAYCLRLPDMSNREETVVDFL